MDHTPKTGKTIKVLLTGGHGATTGLAVIEEIRRRLPGVEIYWIGSKSAISGSGVASLEHKIYPSLGVKYFSILAGKLQTKFTRYTIPNILLFPVGFFQSLSLLVKIRPKVILSLGGFASFPVVFWGWFLGIPVILHEQTVAAGRAAIFSAFFADKIALGRRESLAYFPKTKSVVTGNPMLAEILAVKPKRSLGFTKTILIMGGSRGSEFINEEVQKIVPQLAQKYKIIQITGDRDFTKYKELAGENYQVLAFVNPKDMAKYYEVSDVIVSRAGANSVAEILRVKRPALLIPLPRTFMNEQYKNAKYAEEIGLAKVLTETEVNPSTLLAEIEEMFQNWQKIVNKVWDYQTPDTSASGAVVDLVKEYI